MKYLDLLHILELQGNTPLMTWGGFQVMLSTQKRKWMSVGSQKSLHEGWMHEQFAVHCLNSKGCWQNTNHKSSQIIIYIHFMPISGAFCLCPLFWCMCDFLPNKRTLLKIDGWMSWMPNHRWFVRWILRCEPHLLKGPTWLLLKTFCLSW